jgi:glycosyltransferase involved in cell wall biosynthesis
MSATLQQAMVLLRRHGLLGALRKVAWIVRREGSAGLLGRMRAWRQPRGCGGTGAALPPAGAADGAGAEGLNLVGHPYGALGMGEHIRKSAEAFAAAGVPFSIINTFRQVGPHGAKFGEFPHLSRIETDPRFPVSLFHLNADEMRLASAHLGPAFFTGRYNIGYWAWELARFPDAWCYAFDFFDEIWAPSRFIEQAVAQAAPCPVVHMPLAVDFSSSHALPRSHFKLPERKLLFLFYFDFTSYVARKNPWGPLAAFRAAFPDPDRANVALVIKLNGMEQRPEDYQRFREALRDGSAAGLILLDRVMTDHEVRNLVRNCDCFVSLHRSEGFGRGLAEAMHYGKPVIGTGYSGNLDYMNPDNACLVDYVLVPVAEGEYPHAEGQLWADPDVEQAAWYMRRIADDASLRQRLGARAAQYMHAHHSFAAVGAHYRRRLAKLGFVTAAHEGAPA